jgi:hypothetical protein
MPTIYKVLGQAAPAGTTNVDLYTVPSGRQAVVSSLTLTNDTAIAATARIYVRVSGAAASLSNALVYDVSVAPNAVIALTLGITLGASDVLTVQTGTANALTFMAFGQEVY